MNYYGNSVFPLSNLSDSKNNGKQMKKTPTKRDWKVRNAMGGFQICTCKFYESFLFIFDIYYIRNMYINVNVYVWSFAFSQTPAKNYIIIIAHIELIHLLRFIANNGRARHKIDGQRKRKFICRLCFEHFRLINGRRM